MNLGKLLGSGKTVISGGKAAAYREDKRVYLPKFGSPKNPFAPKPVTETQAELPEPAEPKKMEPVHKFTPPSWARTQTTPVVAPDGAPVRTATWMTKLNPASFFRTGPATADEIASPVQAELSLEKVKVVHNDLMDADVEVVPMKSRPAPVMPDPSPAKKSGEELGNRILRATAL
jgi:hypothetical protein